MLEEWLKENAFQSAFVTYDEDEYKQFHVGSFFDGLGLIDGYGDTIETAINNWKIEFQRRIVQVMGEGNDNSK